MGKLVEVGVRGGRSTKKKPKIGICGANGGDPDSVKFFHRTGLNYVPCSPFRIPIAKLALAQAALEERGLARGKIFLVNRARGLILRLPLTAGPFFWLCECGSLVRFQALRAIYEYRGGANILDNCLTVNNLQGI